MEVDSTCYAIPPPAAVARWVSRTPPGFVFLVKCFGAFCASTIEVGSLPRTTRQILGLLDGDDAAGLTKQPQPQRVSYVSMPEEAKADLWLRFHAALEPIRAAGKLACVLFQFHLNFPHTQLSKEHVELLRERLDGRINMAVEFRNRDWVVGRVGGVRGPRSHCDCYEHECKNQRRIIHQLVTAVPSPFPLAATAFVRLCMAWSAHPATRAHESERGIARCAALIPWHRARQATTRWRGVAGWDSP